MLGYEAGRDVVVRNRRCRLMTRRVPNDNTCKERINGDESI
jgi:hypothetical protein